MNSDDHSTVLPIKECLTTQVRDQLLSLPYSAFLSVITQLLERQGYRKVRRLGRKEFVGRNRRGGWDLEAVAPGHRGLVSCEPGAKCIIQVKQFNALAVQQRSVDELRGCILRAGAGSGLLITTSRFSSVAEAAAQASSLAPVVLLNGEELISTLMQQRLGVCQKPSGKWAIDAQFFRSIRGAEPGNTQANAASNAQENAARKAVLRRRIQLRSSYASPGNGPGNPECTSPTPQWPKRKRTQVLHLSIMLNAEPGGWR